MKGIVISFIVLLFCGWGTMNAQNGAKIKFDETTHQFGKIDKNAPAEHTFTFTNTSEAPLTLTQGKGFLWLYDAQLDPGRS